MRLEPADAPRPGPAPVGAHSEFEPVSSAVRLAWAPLLDAPSPPAGGRVIADLGGTWQRRVEPATEWRTVVVPENFGFDEELSRQFDPVWYRRRIPVPRGGSAQPRARLRFAAVDYFADVWLDDEHLGHHEGYFAPFGFDVTDRLHAEVELLVRVHDPLEPLDPAEFFFSHRKRLVKGTLQYHDSRPGGLPGRMSGPIEPGGDPWVWTPEWGQSMTTAGITGPVTLERTGEVECRALFVTPLDGQGATQLAAVLVNHSAEELEVVLHLGVEGAGRAALATTVPPGPSRIDAVADLAGLARWYPVHDERGGPTLHRLHTVIADSAGLALDRRSTTFGLRLALVATDSAARATHLEVDGAPVFVKAVNYIPWQHFAEVDRTFYDRDFRMLAAAHGNSVGVHAHVQSPHCYEAADAAGVLVFQDFPLQWFYDSGTESNPGFVENACGQIAEMAYLLHDHPSVVYYACHNEPLRMFDPSAAADGPATDRGEAYLDAALSRTLRSVDGSRHVHEASGIGDDAHVYQGSLEGGSMYRAREKAAWFVSEYGFWTIGPQLARFGDEGWPPDAAQMREWVSRLSFIGSTMVFAGTPERYGSLAEWAEATQVYGAALAKYQTEWFRTHRGDPYQGYRWHFWSDWWGYAGGGLVDVERVEKSTYRAFAAANRPLLAVALADHTIFSPGTVTLPVVVVNDRSSATALELSLATHASSSVVLSPDPDGIRIGLAYPGDSDAAVAVPDRVGRLLAQERVTATAPCRAAVEVTRLDVDLEPGCSRTLVLEWTDSVTGMREANTAHLHCPAPGTVYPPGLHRPGL